MKNPKKQKILKEIDDFPDFLHGPNWARPSLRIKKNKVKKSKSSLPSLSKEKLSEKDRKTAIAICKFHKIEPTEENIRAAHNSF